MKGYRGLLEINPLGPGVILVQENGKERALEHIVRYSLSGFNWGYGGSGPADTALSILYD